MAAEYPPEAYISPDELFVTDHDPGDMINDIDPTYLMACLELREQALRGLVSQAADRKHLAEDQEIRLAKERSIIENLVARATEA